MNGAEALVHTLVAGGVDICFTNPGTSEMHLVAAIDKVEGLRPVLGLFEGVVTGAADGYARMAEKPASTLLHLGPGLGNGIANLHNARRAFSPIVNIVGDHATYHVKYDAPLTSDLAGIAAPVSGWYRAAPSADDLAGLTAEAVAAAQAYPGQIATLAVPADTAWGETTKNGPATPVQKPAVPMPDARQIDAVAKAIKAAKNPILLLGGQAVRANPLELAGRIAAATGTQIYCDTFNPRHERGAGRVLATPMPYFGEMAIDALKGVDLMVLVGTKEPAAFFAYPGKPSLLIPDGCKAMTLAGPREDANAGLAGLADALGARSRPAVPQVLARPEIPQDGDLTADAVGRIVGALMPEGAVVSDEGISSGLFTAIYTVGAAPHDWMSLMGGAIGQGLPLATGAALGAPDRKTICLSGDGSAMYTLQSLWTMARENLDVVTVIFANRTYAILQIELMRVGAENPGAKAMSMLDIGNPELGWVKLAEGMGVPAVRAQTVAEFQAAFERGMKERGPLLIEAVI